MEKAAAKGDAEAQHNLGYLFNDGLGVAKDVRQTEIWYRLAATGIAEAQCRPD